MMIMEKLDTVLRDFSPTSFGFDPHHPPPATDVKAKKAPVTSQKIYHGTPIAGGANE